MIWKFIKEWMLIIAMLAGGFSYKITGYIAFIIPYLIFTMLLITFCRMSPTNIRFSRLHGWLLLIQVTGSLLVYGVLQFIDPVLAQGAMVCVMVSTATSAAVITGMLGGNVPFLTTYTLLSSVAVAVAAPLVFSFIGTHSDTSFLESFYLIFRQVGLLLILPLLIAWALQYFAPSVTRLLEKGKQLPFYLWAVSLTIVTGNTVRFLIEQESPRYWLEVSLSAAALVICVIQFALGRYLGRKYNNDPVSAGQGLGQKNTVLAIWMAQTYLNPVASVAPAAYVLWQNIINSYQLWRKARKDERGE